MSDSRKLGSCIAELMDATRAAGNDPDRDDFVARFRQSYPTVFAAYAESLCEAELWSRAQRLMRPASQAPEQLSIPGVPPPLNAYHVKDGDGNLRYRFAENMTRSDWESSLLLKEESLAQDQARLEDDRDYFAALMSVPAFAAGEITTVEAVAVLKSRVEVPTGE